jgi:hypothetical protein
MIFFTSAAFGITRVFTAFFVGLALVPRNGFFIPSWRHSSQVKNEEQAAISRRMEAAAAVPLML